MPMEGRLLMIAAVLGVVKFLMSSYARKHPKGAKRRVWNEIKEWVDTGFIALILAALIMTFIIQAFRIPSSSMEDTLKIGDHLFALKFTYGTRIPFTDKFIWPLCSPHRGDIIIFRFPKDPKRDFIKRVIGIPGDTVEVRNKVVYINGEPLNEQYAKHSDYQTYPDDPWLPESYRQRDNFGPIEVPDGYYFVMGDNRDASYDSRFWGALERRYIKGKAWIVYWPPARWKVIR